MEELLGHHHAVASCKRSLALDPEDSDAAELLKRLSKGDNNPPPAPAPTAPRKQAGCWMPGRDGSRMAAG